MPRYDDRPVEHEVQTTMTRRSDDERAADDATPRVGRGGKRRQDGRRGAGGPERSDGPPPCPAGWETGPPDFVGVGVQKAGTTWWFNGIASHPDVIVERKGFAKEVLFFQRYFSPRRADPLETYYDYFPRPPGGGITGEWSPVYMFDALSIPALHSLAPEAKILVLLRDPVERYLSGLARTVRRKGEVKLDTRRQHMLRGLYHEQLTRLLDWYDEHQVLVLQYERCSADPASEMQRTLEFLGLRDDVVPPTLTREFNVTASEDKTVHTPTRLDLLERAFVPDVKRLVKDFPQIDLSLWPHFRDLD
jgi:hypothetical protein